MNTENSKQNTPPRNLSEGIHPIKSILIANRGEIASRVIRTCRKLGIRAIAVYSEADREALYVREADTAYYLGPSNPKDSYLNQEAVITIAREAGADAIHPGYGFLSENHEFAQKCADEDILFIGPHPDAIQQMGSKALAKSIMADNNIPVLPGYEGENQQIETLEVEAIKTGFPILLKASAGGGGKGMRIVNDAAELRSAIDAAKRESLNAFGDDRLIIEKYIRRSRHIEFQIFGDKHGNVIHLFERECSLQRRYQKIIEESPSPGLTPELREKMAAAATAAGRALNYDNAGTVEFILDVDIGQFYFLEVNTRLQVEHPVTEAITGLDLVALQIASAQGLPLSVNQESVSTNGYAVEARIYAEDPENNFQPVTGTIQAFRYPKEVEGFRIETAVTDHSEISIYYDPMIAKVIIWSTDRSSALQKLNYTLRHMVCSGITTNLAFLQSITDDSKFLTGDYDTGFIPEFLKRATDDKEKHTNHLVTINAFLYDWKKRENQRRLLRHLPSGWRNNYYTSQKQIITIGDDPLVLNYKLEQNNFLINIDDGEYMVRIIRSMDNQLQSEVNGTTYLCSVFQENHTIHLHNESWGNKSVQLISKFPELKTEQDPHSYKTPMPAQIIKILVSPGQKVSNGDSLAILSSMKMESTITAESNGFIVEVYAKNGQNVSAGFQLFKFQENT